MMCHYIAHCLALRVLYCIILSSVTYGQFQWSTRKRNVSILYIVIIVFYLKVELIVNGNEQELMKV